MQIFFFLLYKLIPLYLLILLGFLAGRFLQTQKETVARLLIYIITPVVVFYGVSGAKLNSSLLLLPVIFFLLACFICLTFYSIGKKFWQGPTKNILAFATGAGNTGYFGVPVAVALYGNQILGAAVLAVLGMILYENTLGFFITARGQYSAKEAFIKVIKLPSVYAFLLGVLFSFFRISINPIVPWLENFKAAYSIFGMMLIGMAMAGIKKFEIDIKFTLLTFFAKFAVWPALMLALIYCDSVSFRFLDPSLNKILLLLAAVPLAANTVAFASELKAEPEKASIAVLFSTLFALIYTPLFVLVFLY